MEKKTTSNDSKFSRESVLQPSKIRKGQTRWNQCYQRVSEIDEELLQGPILDFGSGVGYFVLEGLKRGMNIWGLDILAGKMKRFKNLVQFSGSPSEWSNRCMMGDGTSLPFPSNSFSLITSWFVFEHIEKPGEVLRELVRVTRKGGVILIRAQDGRCTYEGHCKIPWIPYLRKDLEKVWIEQFGKSPDLRDGVYDHTQPQIISILETLGCTIVSKDEELPPPDPRFLQCDNEEQVKELAILAKSELESGKLILRQDGLYLCARKL